VSDEIVANRTLAPPPNPSVAPSGTAPRPHAGLFICRGQVAARQQALSSCGVRLIDLPYGLWQAVGMGGENEIRKLAYLSLTPHAV
jgi:hypothetical protein